MNTAVIGSDMQLWLEHGIARIKRLLHQPTLTARFLSAAGMFLVGWGMLLVHTDGAFILMQQVLPLQLWGLILAAVSGIELIGVAFRLPYIMRVLTTVASSWLWAVIALSQLATPPFTALEPLLLLPLMACLWTLIQVVGRGRRTDA